MPEKYERIDVIIPAYNVPDNILARCLASIAAQNNVELIDVTIVDDASTEQNYENVADIFRPLMHVNVIGYSENKGPGVARQYGYDHSSNELVTFIDADDTFAGAFALSIFPVLT